MSFLYPGLLLMVKASQLGFASVETYDRILVAGQEVKEAHQVVTADEIVQDLSASRLQVRKKRSQCLQLVRQYSTEEEDY